MKKFPRCKGFKIKVFYRNPEFEKLVGQECLDRISKG
jgi:hypothetical protein